MTLSIAMQAAGLGIILLAPGQLGLLGAAALFGLGYRGVLPLWGVLIGVTFGREVFGRVMGAMGPLLIPFQMLGVPFATWIYDRNGSYDAAFGSFIGLYVVASGILLFVIISGGARYAQIAVDANRCAKPVVPMAIGSC